MPIRQLDRAAIRREARELIRTARVSPIKFTLLFLAVSLALSLLDTALTYLTGSIVGVAFVSVSFASILIGLITQVLDAGYKCYCLGVHRREEMPYESLFDGFTFADKGHRPVHRRGLFRRPVVDAFRDPRKSLRSTATPSPSGTSARIRSLA